MANYGAHVMMCTEHGRSPWCFEDHDGTHLDYEECACMRLRASPNCDLAIHREWAKVDRGVYFVNGLAGV